MQYLKKTTNRNVFISNLFTLHTNAIQIGETAFESMLSDDHLMCVHIICSLVSVAEWPPFVK